LYEQKEELNYYIDNLEKAHVWGGDLEMSILSKLYNCIFVIHATNRPDIRVDNTDCKK
jgi:hypothetical protein